MPGGARVAMWLSAPLLGLGLGLGLGVEEEPNCE